MNGAANGYGAHLPSSQPQFEPPIPAPPRPALPSLQQILPPALRHDAASSPVRATMPSPRRDSSAAELLLKDTPTIAGEKRKRNPLACESCRSKKAKCDGVQPTCSNCASRHLECVYRAHQRKAQRTEEYVRELELRLARYEASGIEPPDLSPGAFASSGGSNSGLDTLSSAVHYVQTRQRDPGWGDESDEQSGEGAADGMGVPGEKDTSTFFGKSAISTVFRDIRPSISGPANDKLSPVSQPTPKSAAAALPPSLALEDDGGLPPRVLADALLAAYWRYVHTLYPFLDEKTYRDRYERFWHDDEEMDQMELGILNLKFALGAHFLGDRLTPAEAQTLGIRFFRRARDVIGARLMAGGSLRGVQALLLMGQYAQSTNQPNFCWNVIGLAVHIAQGLGLHLEASEDSGFSDHEREIRRRTFWICFVMDRMVSTTFGRPTSIREDMSSARLPSPNASVHIVPSETLEPGQPDLIHFLAATARLSRLQGAVLDSLYAQTGTLALERLPLTKLLELDCELKAFEDSLPSYLKMTTAVPWSLVERQRNVLRLRILNLRILLHRPCLLQSVRDDRPQKELSPTNDLNLEQPLIRYSAQICLEAARQTIELLHATHKDRDKSGASWYSLYYTFQGAVSILLLKLHVEKGPPRTELRWQPKDEAALSKATEILEHLSSKSPTAATCYQHLQSASQRAVRQPQSAAVSRPVTAVSSPKPPYSGANGGASYSMPALGYNYAEPDFSFDSLFTSASLPLPYEMSSYGASGVFPVTPGVSQTSNLGATPEWTTSWPAFEIA